jgi:hypothetical protein
MPYIKQEQRKELAEGRMPRDPGELNYQITRMLLDYLKNKGESYGVFNEIMGVLTCASEEFYRRWVIPYEEKKIRENGDVR